MVFVVIMTAIPFATVATAQDEESPVLKGWKDTYTYGDDDFEVYVEGAEGRNITYSIIETWSVLRIDPDVATIINNTVSINRHGKFKIQAVIEEDENNEEVVLTSDLITVKPFTPTVTIEVVPNIEEGEVLRLGNTATIKVAIEGIEGKNPPPIQFRLEIKTPDGMNLVENPFLGEYGTREYIYKFGSNSYYPGKFTFTAEYFGDNIYYGFARSDSVSCIVSPYPQPLIWVEGIPDSIICGDTPFEIRVRPESYTATEKFNFTIIEGNDVISLEQKIVFISNNPVITPLKAGTAKIRVQKNNGWRFELSVIDIEITVKEKPTNTIDAITLVQYLTNKINPESKYYDIINTKYNGNPSVNDAKTLFNKLSLNE